MTYIWILIIGMAVGFGTHGVLSPMLAPTEPTYRYETRWVPDLQLHCTTIVTKNYAPQWAGCGFGVQDMTPANGFPDGG